jgi:hypothetical protein
MKLVIAYYLKEESEFIYFEYLEDIDDVKIGLYSLKLIILQNYYGAKYKIDVVDNQEEYERFFDEHFSYNYDTLIN